MPLRLFVRIVQDAVFVGHAISFASRKDKNPRGVGSRGSGMVELLVDAQAGSAALS
jgi:hypothetical protein